MARLDLGEGRAIDLAMFGIGSEIHRRVASCAGIDALRICSQHRRVDASHRPTRPALSSQIQPPIKAKAWTVCILAHPAFPTVAWLMFDEGG